MRTSLTRPNESKDANRSRNQPDIQKEEGGVAVGEGDTQQIAAILSKSVERSPTKETE
jgi:hypothetical protein